MAGRRPVDSQISPYGPRISKSESASKRRPRRPKNGAKGMPQPNSLISRLCHGRAWDEWDENGDGQDAGAPVPTADSTKPRSRRRRTAVAVTFAALFVAGAAFSAAAGDQVRASLEGAAASEQASTDGTTTDATAAPASTDPAPAADPADPAPAADPAADGGALAP